MWASRGRHFIFLSAYFKAGSEMRADLLCYWRSCVSVGEGRGLDWGCASRRCCHSRCPGSVWRGGRQRSEVSHTQTQHIGRTVRKRWLDGAAAPRISEIHSVFANRDSFKTAFLNWWGATQKWGCFDWVAALWALPSHICRYTHIHTYLLTFVLQDTQFISISEIISLLEIIFDN